MDKSCPSPNLLSLRSDQKQNEFVTVNRRFEIGAKAKVPDDGDSVIFFELRYQVKGKEQAPKYWSFVAVSKLSSQARLQVM